MQWKGRRQSTNVEDRRGGTGLKKGGISIGGIIIALILWKVFGINPATTLGVAEQMQSTQSTTTSQSADQQESGAFVKTVLADTEDIWTPIFAQAGQHYVAPKLIMFTGSCVLVFCRFLDLKQSHLDKVLQAEQQAGRFKNDEVYATRKNLTQEYLRQYSANPQKLAGWMREQVFIALGQCLLSAQMLGIDATAIGGFSEQLLDEALDLPAKNLTSVVLVALGHASLTDPNRNLPKARLASQDIFEILP